MAIKDKNKLKIALAAGGTGGHLFPAVALAEELNQHQEVQSFLITDHRCVKYLSDEFKNKRYVINIHLKMAGLWNKVKSIFQIASASAHSLLILYKEKPDLLVGFGGYPSFPAMLAAKLLSIPLVIHEQNCFMGRVNKFFTKDAEFIATSYQDTTNIPKCCLEKVILTGNLVRKSLNSVAQYNANGEIFNIFVMGGSQGASIFNKLIPETITVIKTKNPQARIRVTQQVSEDMIPAVESYYNKIGVECELSSFFKNMAEIYARTHLMVARSGASTVAEVIRMAIPTIYVPYPHAKDDHQFFNAQSMVRRDCGWCYRQGEINKLDLADLIIELMDNRDILAKISKNIANQGEKDSAKHLADTVLKIICSK
ncbi:MAG: hypothetical protein DGJ47_000256 [Rickettsiaceae bacterium]